jgi:hypothetical protein
MAALDQMVTAPNKPVNLKASDSTIESSRHEFSIQVCFLEIEEGIVHIEKLFTVVYRDFS